MVVASVFGSLPVMSVAVATAPPVAAATAPPADQVSPGFAGFVVMFLLAIATLLLVRSMVGHLRKVRYSPDTAIEDDTTAASGRGTDTGGTVTPGAAVAPGSGGASGAPAEPGASVVPGSAGTSGAPAEPGGGTGD